MPTPAGPSPQPVAIIKRPARFSPPAVVWLCGLLYFATASGRLGTWDADLYYTVTQRIATERRLDIPREMTLSHTEAWRGPDGLYYSPFDLGQSIANLPFYALGRLAAARLPESARDFAARGAVAASNALWTALTVWVVFLAAGLLAPGGPAESSRESTAKDGAAAWRFQTGAALLYGLGTLAWPYSAMGFNQPLAALGQTIGLWGTMRLLQRPNANDALLVGAGCAMAIFTRLNTILAVPWYMAAIALILWCAQHSPPDKNGDNGGVSATKIAKIKLAFGLPIAAALLANACYNYLRFGSFFHTGYRGDPNTAFSLLAIPKGLAILVFSPAKGAIYYMPLLALSLIGWLHWFRGADRMEGAAAPDTAIQLLAWRRRMAATMGGGIALFYLLFFLRHALRPQRRSQLGAALSGPAGAVGGTFRVGGLRGSSAAPRCPSRGILPDRRQHRPPGRRHGQRPERASSRTDRKARRFMESGGVFFPARQYDPRPLRGAGRKGGWSH